MSAAVSPPQPLEQSRNYWGSTHLVYKSGPLFLSSKGLGWKSWKRRWFILTRTSLVFFKNDPNAVPQKGSDMNLTLGGIDLNNSGSVLVRAEKKLLTVLFPDGRAFTLKAETVEDVDDWKEALERALEAAPNAGLVVDHDTAFQNEIHDAFEGLPQHGRDQRAVKSSVVRRPILLALEDIDGSSSFLEKALCFIEQYGVGVEGILRQSADVDDVYQRVKEYEEGRNQFTQDEDAHVIGDCIKEATRRSPKDFSEFNGWVWWLQHFLRELPSPPVPTPCCTALLEARYGLGVLRVLRMMRAVSAHTAENRMTASAVAACMAPLLLRPLLAGDCGLEDDSEFTADDATQLLAATAAATNAQAIVTMLLEEYDSLFQEAHVFQGSPSPHTHKHMEGNASDAYSEDDDDDYEALHVMRDVDGGYLDATNDLHEDIDYDTERALSGTFSGSSGNLDSDLFYNKVFEGGGDSDDEFSGGFGCKENRKSSPQVVNVGSDERSDELSLPLGKGAVLNISTVGCERSPWHAGKSPPSSNIRAGGNGLKSKVKRHASTSITKRSSLWGLSSANNKISKTDVNDSSGEEDLAIYHLEVTRNDLRTRIAKQAKGNAILQASFERRKQALHNRRLALEQEITRLQDQLESERDLRAALEIGLSMSAAQLSAAQTFDSKTRAEVEELAALEADVARLKQKVADLHLQLNQQRRQQHGASLADSTERRYRVKSLQAQQRILQQELNLTLALCRQEKQRNERMEGQGEQEEVIALEHIIAQQRNALVEAKEALLAERARSANLQHGHSPPLDIVVTTDWHTLQPPAGPSAAGRQFAWRHHSDPLNLLDHANADYKGVSLSHAPAVGHVNGKRLHLNLQRQSPTASAALVELATRLDFFKERRSQLINQLNSLDPSLVPSSLSSHDLIPASP